jgi:hypothetical protein
LDSASDIHPRRDLCQSSTHERSRGYPLPE